MFSRLTKHCRAPCSDIVSARFISSPYKLAHCHWAELSFNDMNNNSGWKCGWICNADSLRVQYVTDVLQVWMSDLVYQAVKQL